MVHSAEGFGELLVAQHAPCALTVTDYCPNCVSMVKSRTKSKRKAGGPQVTPHSQSEEEEKERMVVALAMSALAHGGHDVDTKSSQIKGKNGLKVVSLEPTLQQVNYITPTLVKRNGVTRQVDKNPVTCKQNGGTGRVYTESPVDPDKPSVNKYDKPGPTQTPANMLGRHKDTMERRHLPPKKRKITQTLENESETIGVVKTISLGENNTVNRGIVGPVNVASPNNTVNRGIVGPVNVASPKLQTGILLQDNSGSPNDTVLNLSLKKTPTSKDAKTAEGGDRPRVVPKRRHKVKDSSHKKAKKEIEASTEKKSSPANAALTVLVPPTSGAPSVLAPPTSSTPGAVTPAGNVTPMVLTIPTQMPIADPRVNLMMLAECQMAVRADEDGDLPLHIAVVQEDMGAAKKLIALMQASQVAVDYCNKLRQTPLHLAVITNQPEMVQCLLLAGASANIPDRRGNSALHLAVQNNCKECLVIILSQSKVKLNLNTKNYEGFAAVHMAVQKRELSLLTMLIRVLVDLDVQDGKSGRTALYHACETNQLPMVEILLKNGASVNLQCYSGATALHAASGRGFMDIVAVLVRFGADTTVKNANMEFFTTRSDKISKSTTAALLKSTMKRSSPSAGRRKGKNAVMKAANTATNSVPPTTLIVMPPNGLSQQLLTAGGSMTVVTPSGQCAKPGIRPILPVTHLHNVQMPPTIILPPCTPSPGPLILPKTAPLDLKIATCSTTPSADSNPKHMVSPVSSMGSPSQTGVIPATVPDTEPVQASTETVQATPEVPKWTVANMDMKVEAKDSAISFE